MNIDIIHAADVLRAACRQAQQAGIPLATEGSGIYFRTNLSHHVPQGGSGPGRWTRIPGAAVHPLSLLLLDEDGMLDPAARLARKLGTGSEPLKMGFGDGWAGRPEFQPLPPAYAAGWRVGQVLRLEFLGE